MTTPNEAEPESPDDTEQTDPSGPDNQEPRQDGPGDGGEGGEGEGLKPPYDVQISVSPEGGWSIVVQWNYSVRWPEIESFSLNRQKRGATAWEVVAEGLQNSTRTHRDLLPDEDFYTYTVTAHPLDGSAPLTSEPPKDAAGEIRYIQADIPSTKPQNIHKPLRSTLEKMFIAWNYHASASSYLLEAIDTSGNPYMTVRVTDTFAPFGLFVGPHPTNMITARVTIMRRRDDGTEYPASSAETRVSVDDIPDPHWAVLDIEGQASTSLDTRSLGYSVVLALAEYGTEMAQLTVNGVVYYDVWLDHHGHKSATVETCFPRGSAVTAAMRITAPDNLQSGS